MNTITADITVSSVNMEDRQKLGIKPGDTVRVHQKIQERGKTRIQVLEGLVLARKHGNEPGATFTVRKVVDGVGVERIFPLYSPLIDKIEIIRRSKVRRAKLYHIREKVAREIKRQMRRMKLTSIATESEAEAKVRAEEEAKRAEEEAAKAEEAAVATEDSQASEDTKQEEAPAEEQNEAPEETPVEKEAEAVEESKEEAPAEDAKESESVEETKEPAGDENEEDKK